MKNKFWEPKLWIMYCGCPHKGFVKRYATRRAVMRAVCYARKKVPLCCTDERYKIGWEYDFAERKRILKNRVTISS
jgi:hypothetical protein